MSLRPQLDPQSVRLLQRLRKKLETSGQVIADVVRDLGIEAQEQMTHNLSGTEVSYSGGRFKINVQTGNLRRRVRLEYPYQGDPYSVGIFNNASYAQRLQEGVSGEQRKRELLGSQKAKRSRSGRAYLNINNGKEWWTIHEDSELADQPPRPFVDATLEQMQPRMVERLAQTFAELLS